MLLAAEPDIEVVGQAADGLEAIEQALATTPDVVVMDLQMPRASGVVATREITARLPATRVVVLTTFDHDELVFEAIRAGNPVARALPLLVALAAGRATALRLALPETAADANRKLVMTSSFLVVHGQVQSESNVVHVVARRFTDLSHRLSEMKEEDGPAPRIHSRVTGRLVRSRDFH